MTSLQISYFLKTAECMSFSGAAQALYVTQPSVSRQIKLLETELGYPLFDRTRKNALRLTAEGIIFREAFSRIQRQYTMAQDLARDLSGRSPMTLRVGVGSGWDLSRELTQARREIEARFPQAQIVFESQDFRELRRQIRDGESDVILCTKTSLMDFDGLEVAEIAVSAGDAVSKGQVLFSYDTQGLSIDVDDAAGVGIPHGHGTGAAAVSGPPGDGGPPLHAQPGKHSAGAASG